MHIQEAFDKEKKKLEFCLSFTSNKNLDLKLNTDSPLKSDTGMN